MSVPSSDPSSKQNYYGSFVRNEKNYLPPARVCVCVSIFY